MRATRRKKKEKRNMKNTYMYMYMYTETFSFRVLFYEDEIIGVAVVGYKNPAIATQSGHWLPQPCIAWNKNNKN